MKKRESSPPVAAPRKKRVKWDGDGVDGGKSSIEILLGWLTEPGNYQRYRGGDPHCGLSKNALAGGIVGRMVDAGIKHHNVKDVTVKIAAIESSFKDAVYFLGGTGAGIKNGNDLRTAVRSYCPYYYELVEIMRDRAGVHLDADNNNETDSVQNPSTPIRVVCDSLDAASSPSASSSTSSGEKSKAPSMMAARKGAQNRVDEKLADIEEKISAQAEAHHQENLLLARERQAHKVEIATANLQIVTEREKRESKKDELNMRILLAQASRAEVEAKIAVLKARKELLDAGIAKEEVDAVFPLS